MMSGIISVRYTSVRDDILMQIDRPAGLNEQLQNLQTELASALAICAIVTRIEVAQLLPASGKITTLARVSLNWKKVRSALT